MTAFFGADSLQSKELRPGVLAANLYRYAGGGGAAIFSLKAGASMPEHNHPTGEHGYIIAGQGRFGGELLSTGDAFWVGPNERHEVEAVTDLVFFACSLRRIDL